MNGTQPIRRTQSERRAEAKQRVLEAAAALVAVHGSRLVSLAAVGEAAGYSRGIVNHHFGSKARLLADLVEYTQQFTVEPDSSSALGRLAHFVEAYLGGIHDRSPRSEAFLKLWTESTGAEPTLASIFAERDAAFRELLTACMREGVRDGSIRCDVQPDAAAVALIGQLRGSALMVLSTARDVPVPELTAEVVRLVRLGFKGP